MGCYSGPKVVMKDIRLGDVVSIEHDWVQSFALIPHKTISGRWVWLQKIYIRRVWVYNGFTDEPDTQYAELFDIIKYG